MLSLNPEKLLIVLIVALVLLGPDKLPKLAHQMGAGWAKLRAFQQRMESEVRETIPNLPTGQEIARIARSPVSYLNTMAASARDELLVDPAAPESEASNEGGAWPVDPGAPVDPGVRPDAPSSNGHGASLPTPVRPVGIPGHQVPADPGMN